MIAPTTTPAHPGFAAALRFWLWLGCISFGGPAGQIAVMHRELVDRRRWMSEARFLHALNYCMVLPGPEAQQLATYMGWLLHGARGGLPAVACVLYGIKPAVTAIVAQAAWRIGGRTLRNAPRWSA